MAPNTEVSVTLICPNLACRKTNLAPESARGTNVRCAYCSTPFRIPIGKGVRPAPEPAPEPAQQKRAK